tara:strand:+ start:2007 stop:2849 length:843 start_codon:yes stop_codon:yes gene_type:complete
MKADKLRSKIEEISKISNDVWMKSLNERKRKEFEFHNEWYDKERIDNMDEDSFEKYYSNEKFYSTVQKSDNYKDNWIKEHTKNKVFLDYACGNGKNAIYAAKNGASLSLGFDINRTSVLNAKQTSEKEKIDNVIFFQADAENTNLPDECVDTIICSGMLHHLDLSYSFPELRRILAKNGRILAIEALDYNPFIKLYRNLTPSMRTEFETEHILDHKDIEFARRFFDVGDIKYWHVTSYAGAYVPKLLPLFNSLDSLLVKIPGVRLLSWIFTFELLKKTEK